MIKQLVFTVTLMLLPLASLADGWMTSGIAGMNEEIEQTNFIVGGNCSGTLIDLEQRWILTNHHCVVRYIKHKIYQEPDQYGIVHDVKYEEYKPIDLSQKTYKDHDLVAQSSWVGELIGYDVKTDLALIQLRATEIPHSVAATLYASEEAPMRGETVFAVGNPLGLDLSVTKGIISSVNRRIKVTRESLPYYQIDALINGGNSGGALYNEDGALIGVPAAGGKGIGLAIPYTKIHEFLETFAMVEETVAEEVE